MPAEMESSGEYLKPDGVFTYGAGNRCFIIRSQQQLVLVLALVKVLVVALAMVLQFSGGEVPPSRASVRLGDIALHLRAALTSMMHWQFPGMIKTGRHGAQDSRNKSCRQPVALRLLPPA